jgi:acyl dehydratase
MKLALGDLQVGQVFQSKSHRIELADIKSFATQFDPQPFHLDEELAKDSFFGELVASGWHVAALTMRLLVESTPIKGGLVGAGGDIQWLRPTRPGDDLSVDTEITAIKHSDKRPERATVTVRSTTKNQHGEAVMIMSSRLVVPA